MFIPTINTGGREAPFSTPLGLEAKSLKNGMTHYWISRAHENKQTKKKEHTYVFKDSSNEKLKEINLLILFVCLEWAWILKSSNGSSHFSGI